MTGNLIWLDISSGLISHLTTHLICLNVLSDRTFHLIGHFICMEPCLIWQTCHLAKHIDKQLHLNYKRLGEWSIERPFSISLYLSQNISCQKWYRFDALNDDSHHQNIIVNLYSHSSLISPRECLHHLPNTCKQTAASVIPVGCLWISSADLLSHALDHA